MITFITGKPGGGKTLRSLQVLFDALKNDDRDIVTNVPLHLDMIQEYCDRNGLKINVAERIWIIDDDLYNYPNNYRFTKLDWLRKFYLYRGKYSLIEWSPDTDLEDFFKPLFVDPQTGEPTGRKGILYIIDETRKLYPARNFAKMDNRVFDYFGLHRHLGDDVYLICQFVGQVDKQIRGYGQTFEVIRNRAKEKYSIFRGEARFQRYVYLEPPMKNVTHSEKTSFPLNKEQASCYSTSAMGGTADQGQKAKGIHYYWFPVGVVFTVALGIFVLTQVPKFFFSKAIDTISDTSETLEDSAEEVFVDKPLNIPQEVSKVIMEDLKVSSLMILNNLVFVTLTDGSSFKTARTNYRGGSVYHNGRVFNFVTQ
jgi:hypothetical protein